MAKDSEERRLWIGNLDPRVTEYHLLKLVQKYGTIEKFDLLFHRTGPLLGQPRGYAFVTFVRKEDAVRARELHNKLVGNKNIAVTWAHSIPTDEPEKPKKAEMKIPALAIAKTKKSSNREFQIQAIEAKLKVMEHQQSKELEINKILANETPIVTQYQFNKQSTSTTASTYHNTKRTRPYEKRR